MIGRRVPLYIACVAVASCAGAPNDVRSQDVHYDQCAGVGADPVNTCTLRAGVWICPVWVFERFGLAPVVYPYTLVTPGPTPGATTPRTVIVWRLRGGNFRNAADGPIIINPGNEFSDGTPSDSDGSVGSAGPSPHYRIKFLNSLMGSYKYTIKFKDSNGDVVTCDPKINNSGG